MVSWSPTRHLSPDRLAVDDKQADKLQGRNKIGCDVPDLVIYQALHMLFMVL